MQGECEFCGTTGDVQRAGRGGEFRLCYLCRETVPLWVVEGNAPSLHDLMRVVLGVGNILLAKLESRDGG